MATAGLPVELLLRFHRINERQLERLLCAVVYPDPERAWVFSGVLAVFTDTFSQVVAFYFWPLK